MVETGASGVASSSLFPPARFLYSRYPLSLSLSFFFFLLERGKPDKNSLEFDHRNRSRVSRDLDSSGPSQVLPRFHESTESALHRDASVKLTT